MHRILKRTPPDSSSYSLSGVENIINSSIQTIFFYRLIFVLLALSAVTFFSFIAWFDSEPKEKIRNLAAVLGCGSIVLGIFYAILNYEIIYVRYKRDKMLARKQLSFQVAAEWQKDNILNHLKVTKVLYETNKHLIEENKSKEFSEIVEADEKARFSLLSIFNFLECIALGVHEEVLDEEFVKGFFKTIFISYLNDYDFFIKYRRKKNGSPTTWINLTELATKWRG